MPERVRGGGAGGVTIRSDTHADHTTCTKLTTTNAFQQQMRFINFLSKKCVAETVFPNLAIEMGMDRFYSNKAFQRRCI